MKLMKIRIKDEIRTKRWNLAFRRFFRTCFFLIKKTERKLMITSSSNLQWMISNWEPCLRNRNWSSRIEKFLNFCFTLLINWLKFKTVQKSSNGFRIIPFEKIEQEIPRSSGNNFSILQVTNGKILNIYSRK